MTTTTTNELTCSNLHDKAIARGWVVTQRRGDVTYYRTPTGAKAWMNARAETASMAFWFLNHA